MFLHVICGVKAMYLHNPSISELNLLELPLLIEMLSQQTAEYLNLLKEEGYTARTLAMREAVTNMQGVIQQKINAEKRRSKQERVRSTSTRNDNKQAGRKNS